MKRLSLLILALSIYCTCFSQMTIYQKKVVQIQKKYLRIIGVKENYINAANTSEEIKFLWSNAIHTLSNKEGFTIELMCNKEIIEASKLKNAVDFKRDEEANEKKVKNENERLKKAQEIITKRDEAIKEEEKKKELLQEEILKKEKEENIQEQKQQKLYQFESSDYGKIQKLVKKEFETWLQKGEFESNLDFEKRIKTQAETKFTSIVNENQIKSKTKKLNRVEFVKLGTYDAESEICILLSKPDTLSIKLSKNIAEDFYNNFRKKEKSYYNNNGETAILLYPTEYVMENNYWKIINAVLIFNNYSYEKGAPGGIVGPFQSEKMFKKNNDYYYGGTNYENKKFNSAPYKIINLESIQNSNQLQKDMFYLEINFKIGPAIQNLNFKYADLDIKIPQF